MGNRKRRRMDTRKLLCEAANSFLCRCQKKFALKTMAMNIAKRRGFKKVRVALPGGSK
ncbi:hypothetical protein U5A82_03050 [Sphingobium sp. CR2-8]|uniref:hypothetical protein n=1 Tax=Sphingobium sp. CR2-8 TaxID=1306534 RepID=UPI002DBBA523|nr:hypothetical protein [Sphingobium sp. CR2-8]MEC3909482.1 hypothetical protein [Sphingobium sp. CR2-8]